MGFHCIMEYPAIQIRECAVVRSMKWWQACRISSAAVAPRGAWRMYCHGGNKGAHLNFAITMYHPSAVPIAEAVEKIFDLYNERNPNQETSQQVPVSSGQLTCSPPRYLA